VAAPQPLPSIDVTSFSGGTTEATDFAFSLARKVALALLKRSIERQIRVIVEKEVQAAVLEHMKALRAEGSPAVTQVVIGEVYNVVQRVPGVVRIGGSLHIDAGEIELEPRAVDDPHLNALVRQAQDRLNAAGSAPDEARTTTNRMFSPAETEKPAAPIFDDRQRLTPEAADRYRDRLDRLAREDQIR
jgi:hypothetical protein